MLIVGRAVAGMGGAGLVNGALTILADSVPLVKRACKKLPLVGKVLSLAKCNASSLTEFARISIFAR
jgi:MFS family permease